MVNQEEMLSVLLAYSDTWQELTESADADEALQKIKAGQAETSGSDAVSRPWAVIEEVERERTQKATRTTAGRGALLISIEMNPPDDTLQSVELQRTWFKEQIDAIELDLRTTSQSRSAPAGYNVSHFQIKNISWSVEPFLMPDVEVEEQETTEDATQKPIWAMQFRVEY